MWIKPAEAARRVGLSKSAIYNLIASENCPFITKRFAGAIRIDETSFNTWMALSPSGAPRSRAPDNVDAPMPDLIAQLRVAVIFVASHDDDELERFAAVSQTETIVDIWQTIVSQRQGSDDFIMKG